MDAWVVVDENYNEHEFFGEIHIAIEGGLLKVCLTGDGSCIAGFSQGNWIRFFKKESKNV
jgi:hypothetical protein